MRNLFDRAFFKALLGFLLILAVGFSILVVSGAYEDFKKGVAAAIKSAFASEAFKD